MNDIWVWLKMGYIPKLWLLTSGWNGVQSPILYFMAKNDRMHVQQHLFTHAYIYIYLEHRMTIFLQLFDRILPNLEKWQFFLVICPYLAVFGDKWHAWRILINIGNILKTYWKVARLDNIEKILKKIENILETYWKILVSWLPPHACNLEFEILAYMPYDQKIRSYANWPKNTVVWGSR